MDVETSQDAEILSMSLVDFKLGKRSIKAAAKYSVDTVGGILRLSAEDLMECKNFGQTSLDDIRSALAAVGLKLKED